MKAAMWKLMTDNAGNQKHTYNDKTLCVNADGGRERSDKDQAREEALHEYVNNH